MPLAELLAVLMVVAVVVALIARPSCVNVLDEGCTP